MKLQASKEEMKKRFSLYCEIYVLCAEIQEMQEPDCEDLDNFEIDVDDIIEELGLPEDIRIMLDVDKIYGGKVEWSFIEFSEDLPFVYFYDKDGHTIGQKVLDIPSGVLSTVKDYVERYKKALYKNNEI